MLVTIGAFTYLLWINCGAGLGFTVYPKDDDHASRQILICTEYGQEQTRSCRYCIRTERRTVRSKYGCMHGICGLQ
jgi:hypothetical protein